MALTRMGASALTTITLVCLWCVTTAVDRGNFKTCDQSGFCKRQRAMKEGETPYEALMNTLKIQNNKIGVELLNTKNQVKLLLEVIGLDGNMARMRVTELDGIKQRYEPALGEALVADPPLHRVTVDRKDSSGLSLSLGKNKVVMQARPFRLDIIVEDEPVISVNSRGLMKYEHYRQPKEADPPANEGEEAKEGEDEQEAGEAPEPEVKEDDKKVEPEEPDMWEETYKSHKDTKPHGPSSVGLDFSFPGFEHVYGIPEHADTMALKTTKNTDPYRLYNLDVFEYELNNPMALYGSVPYMIAANEKKTVGIFWLNAAETWVDISSNVADKTMMSKLVDFVKGGEDIPQTDTHWFSESGIIDVFFLLGPKPANVFKQYASLTGTTPIPPLFGIAYHQCRWNYNDQQDVANVDAGYDEHDMPMDVIWLDIEHTDGKRYFTWDSNKFPNSVEMINNVAAKGRKMVTIIDPHIKRDDGYKIHKEAQAAGHYVKNKDGGDYDGWCWPGSSGWLDFFNPDIRKYWASKFMLNDYVGSTMDLYTWNDMNEPSVFNGPEVTMHKDAKHYGGWEHRDVHNLYGTLVHRATVEGQLMRSENKERPFVLSRAFFAGSQRYGAIWTGDNTADWGHLKISIPMLLSLNLVGITFSGADVGGFFKNPDAELLTRWYQAAAFQPFFRAHAHLDTRRREPWLLGSEYMRVIRDALRTRYTYLPYWYTLFHHGEKDGGPVMRPLWIDFPEEKQAFTIENEHLIGSALLVHPVTDQGATGVNVYLPGKDEIWYDVKTHQSFNGNQQQYVAVTLDSIPVYQRGGFIIPRRERVRRASSLTYNDPFTLIVALNKQGRSSGDLYIDDYHTFNYQIGQYAFRKFEYQNGVLTNKNADPKGIFKTKAWLERVVILGFNQKPSSISIDCDHKKTQLDFDYNSSTKTLVIRRPGANIAEDSVITIT